MKSFVVCVLFGAVLVSAKPQMPPELMKLMEESTAICQPKTGITTEEIMGFMEKNLPSTREGACFMACMKKEFGVMNPDNTLNIPKLEEMGQPLKAQDPKMFETAIAVATECNDLVTDRADECDVAKTIMDCGMKKAKEMGLDCIPIFGH